MNSTFKKRENLYAVRMIITPLGHTEFLIDIANEAGRNVRILVDAWLSDYAIGDMMERTVKVRLDPEKISTIAAIYISHAHCDHLDPYTLTEIYQHASPTLILPFSLRYLENLISLYLPQAPVKWLNNNERFILHGVELTGRMWSNPEITNEDDVMMLEIATEREMLFAEIDTIPDALDEDIAQSLYKVFTRRDYETACYMSSRNVLEGQIPYYDLPEGKRRAFHDQYIANQKEDIRFQYEKYEYEEYAHFENIFALPGFVRGFIGQGIAYPKDLSEPLFSLSLFPLDEIVSIESDYAKNAGYDFPQKALLPGRQYKIENGNIETGRKECPIGEIVKSEEGEVKNTHTERIFAIGPLFPRDLSQSQLEEGKNKILEILNTRFLPYWSASSVGSLRDALIKNGGVYRIELRITNTLRILFEYSTARTGFIEIPYIEGIQTDEDYWLLDVLDFFDGRQEMYSSFWHRLNPKKIYRLWVSLGANFCNNDLVEQKYRLHFERAKEGKTATDFVGEVLKNL